MLNVGKIISFLLIVVHCSLVGAQSYSKSDSPLTITPAGYYLTIIDASGIPQYTRIETIIDLTGAEHPGPNTPDEPDEPAVDMELVEKVKAWAIAVDDPQSSQAIAAVYSHIRGALADNTLTPDSVWSPLKQATDSGMGVIKEGKDWSEFRGRITEVFTDAKQRGKLSDAKSIGRVLLSVQHGAELAADGSTALTMDQMVEITRRTNTAIDGVTK